MDLLTDKLLFELLQLALYRGERNPATSLDAARLWQIRLFFSFGS